MSSQRPILIAGPTASGKSALALALAERANGVLINADSQQIYAPWRVLTARPSPKEEAQAPHRLYGHVTLDQIYSVGHWLRDVEPVLETCHAEGHTPIIVGGTGLYFKALTQGLAPIPEITPEIRAQGETELERLGLSAFAENLARKDPDTAAKLHMENPRRVLRAWEVLEGTGTGLAAWKARTPPPLVVLEACTALSLAPPREWLYPRCEARFDQMLSEDALDEVRTVMSMDVPAASPGLRAVGATELMAYLNSEMSLEDATQRAKIETRRYAKRQLTWMRNQMTDWARLDPSCPDLVNKAVALL